MPFASYLEAEGTSWSTKPNQDAEIMFGQRHKIVGARNAWQSLVCLYETQGTMSQWRYLTSSGIIGLNDIYTYMDSLNLNKHKDDLPNKHRWKSCKMCLLEKTNHISYVVKLNTFTQGTVLRKQHHLLTKLCHCHFWSNNHHLCRIFQLILPLYFFHWLVPAQLSSVWLYSVWFQTDGFPLQLQ